MESLGKTDISIDSRIVGSLTVRRLRFETALTPRIGLDLSVMLFEKEADTALDRILPFGLTDFRGELRWASQSGPIVEYLQPTQPIDLRSLSYPHDQEISLSARIDWQTIERMEQMRGGDAPSFWFSPICAVVQDGEWRRGHLSGTGLSVPREHWLDYLRHIGYGRVEVLEVPIPAPAGDEVQEAVGYARKARAMLSQGGFSEAASECRLCFEALNAAVKKAGFDDIKKLASERVGHEKPGAEYSKILAGVGQLTAGAHHYYGRHWRWARGETQFQVRLAEATIGLVGGWLEED